MLEGRAGVQEDFMEKVILRLACLQGGDVEEARDEQRPFLLPLNTSPPHPLVLTGQRAIHPEALFLSQGWHGIKTGCWDKGLGPLSWGATR